jgi:DNA replication protein DnaC
MSRAHSLTVATIQEHCRGLRLPTVAAQSERLAQEAARANQSHLNYLAELLGAELEERERNKIERRIKEARLPRMKTLEDFDFSAASHISVKQIHVLAEGSYLERAEPVILIGDSGAGKTHLASGLRLAACKQKKRARFVTAAGLINELVEAQQHNCVLAATRQPTCSKNTAA